MKAFDEHYEPYLKSLGIPGFVVPIILRASETITVAATEKGATMTTQTGEAVRPELRGNFYLCFFSLANSRYLIRVEPCVEHDLRQEHGGHVEQLHQGESERHLLQVNIIQIFSRLYICCPSVQKRKRKVGLSHLG